MDDNSKKIREIVDKMVSFLVPSLNEAQRAELGIELLSWEKNFVGDALDLELFVEKHISSLNRAQKAEILWMIWKWKNAIYLLKQKEYHQGRFQPIAIQERGEAPFKYARSLVPLSHHALSEIRKIKRAAEQIPTIKQAWDEALEGKRIVASVNRMIRDLERKKYADKSEQIIEAKFADAFRDYGMKNLQRQVPLPSGGVIDLMMDNMICEFKHELTRNRLYQAVGQLLLYAAELDRTNDRLVIIGYPTWEAKKLEPIIKKLGIEIVFHEDEDEPKEDGQ